MSTPAIHRGIAQVQRSLAPLRGFSQAILESDEMVPVMVQFHDPPVVVYGRYHPQEDLTQYEAGLQKAHRTFLDGLAVAGLQVQAGKTLTCALQVPNPRLATLMHDFTYLFNGMGMLLPGRSIAELAAHADVRVVTHNRERVYLRLDQSVPFTGAPQVWQRQDAAGKQIRGEGVSVAVIDTGIDWTHPAFGGFTNVPNEKVLYAVSYTGEPPIDNFGHGSHVAGIIAGDRSYKSTPRGDSQINGMAPGARLMSYKVLSAAGSGTSANIVLAIEDAVKRGARIINLSLGDDSSDPLSPECAAANNAVLAGVVVCVAAGNAGPSPRTIGTPGVAHQVLTVGAVTDDGVTTLIAQLLRKRGEPRSIEMRLLQGAPKLATPAIEVEYVACGKGASTAEFPSEVAGRVALIQRGDVTFLQKVTNAQKAGALACLIYNNGDGNFFGTLGSTSGAPLIPAVAISKQDGELMLSLIAQKRRRTGVKIRLNPELVPQPDHLAEFSSRGPNVDGWIKPEITAPGVDIYSATVTHVPEPGSGMADPSGYTNASGTSMATPHVAGAAALLLQAHPSWNAEQVKAALVNTARPLPGQGGPMEQGNGTINLLSAIDCRAVLVTATNPISPTHSFGTVVNEGKKISVSVALTIHGLMSEPDESSYTLSVELAGKPAGLMAEVSAGHIECTTSCVASFDLTVTADGAVLPDGEYAGYVQAEADWGALRLPFFYIAVKKAEPKPAEPTPTDAMGRVPGWERMGNCLPM